jgi:hypothetical protein
VKTNGNSPLLWNKCKKLEDDASDLGAVWA